MSAIGPKPTSLVALHMSAFGGKADMTLCGSSLLRSLLGGKADIALCANYLRAQAGNDGGKIIKSLISGRGSPLRPGGAQMPRVDIFQNIVRGKTPKIGSTKSHIRPTGCAKAPTVWVGRLAGRPLTARA